MLQRIDTGQRKAVVQCDLYGIMTPRTHYKTFKGPDAQREAELFLSTRHLQERGFIEVVMELPRAVEFTPPAEIAVDEDAALAQVAAELTAALRAKKTPDSKELRKRLFALQRVLTARLA